MVAIIIIIIIIIIHYAKRQHKHYQCSMQSTRP